MRILYCNIYLIGRTGTEIVTLETVQELVARGHEVTVYVYKIGPSARALKDRGIHIIDSLSDLHWEPQIIHANHVMESLHVAARFPNVPQIFVCHDSQAWHSAPPQLTCVRKWFAVDELCAKRVVDEASKRDGPVELLPNAVDLKRFQPRGQLPDRPKRILVLSKHSLHFEAIREACHELQIQVDCLGPGAGMVVDHLSDVLPQYDIVIATARMALEAAAVGCAVIIADGRGMAGMLAVKNFRCWQANNFGKALLSRPVSSDAITRAIREYAPQDALRVSQTVRQELGLPQYVDELEEHYRSAISLVRQRPLSARTTLEELPEAFRAALAVNLLGLPRNAHVNDVADRLQAAHGQIKDLKDSLQRFQRERHIEFENRIALNQQLHIAHHQLNSRSFLLKRLIQLVARGKHKLSLGG